MEYDEKDRNSINKTFKEQLIKEVDEKKLQYWEPDNEICDLYIYEFTSTKQLVRLVKEVNTAFSYYIAGIYFLAYYHWKNKKYI